MNKRMIDRLSDDREWQAQERALHDERQGAVASDDPTQAQYRRVARALRQPLPDALPADFAARIAAMVARTPHAAPDLRLEQRLVRALLLLLALSAAVVCALYGSQWLHEIAVVLPGAAGSWTLALMGCVGLSWSFDLLRRHGQSHA